jgi:hypothetical protein
MSKKKWPALRLKQDIVIPSGTVLSLGPVKREWFEQNFEEVIGIHNDGTAYFTIGINDARLRPDLFEETEE